MALRVGVAYPDPAQAGVGRHGRGLDVDLVSAIGARLETPVDLHAYRGADLDGIFERLGAAEYDCVVAGVTVTPQRRLQAAFAPPYLVSGQALAVDTARLPRVRSVDDLAGLTVGVRRGTTSQPIAAELAADGRAAGIRVYDHDDIGAALVDLTSGGCDALLELAPVLTELVGSVGDVEVVQRNVSREEIAIAVALGDDATLQRITRAQRTLEDDGTLQDLRRRWLGNPYRDQGLKVH